MKVVTWNVNSIRARHDRFLAWLENNQPDILCLQELKTLEENFPLKEVKALGYHAAVYGQKTYNGVAIVSKSPLEDIERGFNDDQEEDAQSRLVEAYVNGIHVICSYWPNGHEVGSDKYDYKKRWINRLLNYLEENHDPEDPLVLCGDFNIATTLDDVATAEDWQDGVLFNQEIRDYLTRILDWGFTDTFRQIYPTGQHFSWWDYRRLGFQRGEGLRIDYVYATQPLVDVLNDAGIDRQERKGEKPSDHAPAWADFKWEQP